MSNNINPIVLSLSIIAIATLFFMLGYFISSLLKSKTHKFAGEGTTDCRTGTKRSTKPTQGS